MVVFTVKYYISRLSAVILIGTKLPSARGTIAPHLWEEYPVDWKMADSTGLFMIKMIMFTS